MSGSPAAAPRDTTAPPRAAWYPDPDRVDQPGYHLRYWDGDTWTDWRFEDAAVRHIPTVPRGPARPAPEPLQPRATPQDLDDTWWVAIIASIVTIVGVVAFVGFGYLMHVGEVENDAAAGFLGTFGTLLAALVTPIAALVAMVAVVWGAVAHVRRSRRRSA